MTLYDWDAVPEEAMDATGGDVLRRFVGGEKMTIARVRFKAGAEIEPHTHPNEQFSLVLEGRMEFVVAGVPVIVVPGRALHLPGGVPHGARALEPSVVLDVFAPPRADWGPPRAGAGDAGG